MKPTVTSLPRSPFETSVVGNDDLNAFLRLYRHHPGGPPVTREDLGNPGCIGLLARDDRSRPVGALALRLLPGRRASCYFPVVRSAKSLRLECGASLGAFAAKIARRSGARYIECQYERPSDGKNLEWLPQAILLPFVARHLLMRRETEESTDRVFESEPGTAYELLAVMTACYEGSADPSIRTVAPRDDLANMLCGTGPPEIRKIPGTPTKGAALLRRTGNLSEIVFLGVPPRYQRRGNGRRLLLGCLDWLARENCRLVDLAVAEENLPAIALYESQGFRKRSEALLFRRLIEDCAKDSLEAALHATLPPSSELRAFLWH